MALSSLQLALSSSSQRLALKLAADGPSEVSSAPSQAVPSNRRLIVCRAEAHTAAGATSADASVPRRSLLLSLAAVPAAAAAVGWQAAPLPAAAAPAVKSSLPAVDEDEIKLCTSECEAGIDQFPLQTTPSGLQYRDIVVGKGPSPPVGFQVAANYVAMVPSGKIFDSSLEKKMPYVFRVGSGQVVKGLDEGIMSMKVGGLRRLYVPGQLAFPKGLSSAPGRPRVAPSSPVVFDVQLLYVPGLEDFEEEEE